MKKIFYNVSQNGEREKRPPIQISYISNTNCKLFKNKRTFSALLLIIFPFKFFFLSNFFSTMFTNSLCDIREGP